MLPADIESLCSKAELEYIQRVCQERDVLEIGSYLGASTIAIARVAHSVVSIDWHKGGDTLGSRDTLCDFWQNLRRYGVEENVMVVVGTSAGVLPRLNSCIADIAFVDACHTRRQPYLDLFNAWHCLGAYPEYLVHDFHESWPDVVNGVTEFATKFKLTTVAIVDTLIHLKAKQQ